MSRFVPFNRPYLTGREYGFLQEAVSNGHLAGNGPFTEKCQQWLREHTGAAQALLTHSCTGALEMAALLIDAGPGDEIIMPSFTFVTTASAFALRGAMPVFVDIRPDTLNLDERLVAAAMGSPVNQRFTLWRAAPLEGEAEVVSLNPAVARDEPGRRLLQ